MDLQSAGWKQLISLSGNVRLLEACEIWSAESPQKPPQRSNPFEIQNTFRTLFGGNEMRKEPETSPALFISATGYLQDSLIIFTSVIFMWPCSASLFFMPLSFAASFASSFMLCIAAFDTTPVAVTV